MAADTGSGRPVWVELSSTDVDRARDFYRRLFGWDIEVIADPQYGGYGMARLDGDDVAGLGGQQMPGAPSMWNVYVGTSDVDDLAQKVSRAGGTVIAGPFNVGDQGRMAVFQDPTGASISAWQAAGMRRFGQDRPNTFGWAELNSRNVDTAIRFYERIIGWKPQASDVGGGQTYTEFSSTAARASPAPGRCRPRCPTTCPATGRSTSPSTTWTGRPTGPRTSAAA
ncbi:MAG: VOC family protein [Chloroflexi bacterium]|nr:VOC family protein [Chloroflexota bacterium]